MVPRWKKWLSYLSEVTLEETDSSFNDYLRVSLSKGRFMLSTEGAIYSFGDLYTNFLYAFRALDFSNVKGKDVLILGLGLGSIPDMLEKRFRQSFNYTAVDIDETVIWLAHHYVLENLQSPIEVISADARAYVRQSERQFDLICMDVFLGDLIPATFEQEAYLKDLKRLLRPNGLLVFNRLAMTPFDKSLSRNYYHEIFRSVFPAGGYFDSRTNWMLTNRPEWFKGSKV